MSVVYCRVCNYFIFVKFMTKSDYEMSACELDKSPNKENVLDIRLQKNNVSSQDIFSDDDQQRNQVVCTPKFSPKSDSFNSSIISLKTPVLFSKAAEITPGRATVPKTPVDLLPFISKTSLVWTSDMETPDAKWVTQAKHDTKPESHDETVNLDGPNNTTPNKPKVESNTITEAETLLITSPVLGGKKRTKRRFKRRILNNLASNSDTDQQCSISSNSDKVPSDTANDLSCNLLPCDESKILKNGIKDESKVPVESKCESSAAEDQPLNSCDVSIKNSSAVASDKNLNTSTQEFFMNASFTTIDQLCNGVVDEKSNSLHQLLSNNNAKSPKFPGLEPINIQCNGSEISPIAHVSRDVLERVAAIRRNQKPVRRSTDINQVSISQEVFLQSARDLELADAKFRTEKKINNNQNKSTRVTSFAPLSSLDGNLPLKHADTVRTEEKNCFANGLAGPIVDEPKNNVCSTLLENNRVEVPLSNDTDASIPVDTDLRVENSNGSANILEDRSTLTTGMSDIKINRENEVQEKANARNAVELSENNCPSSSKYIKNIPNPPNEPLQIHVEPNACESEQQINESLGEEEQSCLKKFPSGREIETLKLYQELDLKEFLEPKFSAATMEEPDDISKEVAQERDDSNSIVQNDVSLKNDTLTSKNSLVCSSTAQSNLSNGTVSSDKENSNFLNELPLSNMKTKVKSLVMQSDGFSTASGVGIKIDYQKENFYSKMYEELDDNFDNSPIVKGKNKPLRLPFNTKPKDKAVIIFNQRPVSHAKIGILDSQNPKLANHQLNSLSNPTNLGQKKTPLNSKLEFKVSDKSLEMDKSSSSADLVLNSKLSEPVSQNGFATASGRGIRINEEKENKFLRIYNEISKELGNEDDFHVNDNNLSHIKSKGKPTDKAVIIFNKEKPKNPNGTKLSISSDTDEAFYDLGDLEKLFTSPKHTLTKRTEPPKDNFVIPSAKNIIQKNDQITFAPQNDPVVKKAVTPEDLENVVKVEMEDLNLGSCSEPLEQVPQNAPVEANDLQHKSHVGILRQKFKKPERCRSFGGFPIKNEGVDAVKLNKSDPLNESSTNQPLQTGMSVSQCFDSHSDSWLSNVEITHLNNKKMSPLNVKLEKPDPVLERIEVCPVITNNEGIDEFKGFSSKEVNESFSQYVKFRKFYDKYNTDYGGHCSVSIKSGQTITIINNTSADQQLIVGTDYVNIEKKRNRFSYTLIECERPKDVKIVNDRVLKRKTENSEKSNGNPKTKKIENEQVVDKRKRVTDPDGDTPVTTLKKPRVGCEIQGRKLFSDESDAEHDVEQNVDVDSQIVTSSEGTSQESNRDNVIDQEETVDLSQQRRDAIFDQDEAVNNKKRIRVKPMMGSLLKHRLMNSKKRVAWSELVGDSFPTGRSCEELAKRRIDEKIMEVTASNAVQYRFSSSHVFRNKKSATLDVGDGAILIFDESGSAGVVEFTKSFLAMAGVDPKLLHANWIENHYRWIVWKLASMDRMSFGNIDLPKILTPKRVVDELKYRYDREIDRAQRPALRKILEKDEVPSHRMVLCISSITEKSSNEEPEKEAKVMLGMSRWRVEATDGWYDIPLTIDNAMQSYIVSGKIKEGTKIVTYGAELLDCERGFHPLDKPDNVSLRIHTNCTKRARWDAKLGFQKISRPIPIKLSQIVSSGGMVGEITVVAARVYPLLYREKTSDGQSIYRNAKSEEKAAIAYERAVEKRVDDMYAEAEKNLHSKKKLDSDDEIEISQGATKTQEDRSRERHQEQMKQRIESRVREGLPPPRQVSAVLKVRLCDEVTSTMLTIWGANDSDESGYDIKEGDTITVYNSFAAGFRGGELNLTANRFTRIKKEPLLKLPHPARTCTLIPSIGLGSGFEPKYNEFDTVGVVVTSGPAPYGMKNFDMVALAHPRFEEGGTPAFLSVLFWGGVNAFGYQGVLAPGSLVACSNLEWRRSSSWSIAVAYCSERSLFTSNPRQSYLANELRELRALVQNPKTFAESCGVDLANELLKKPQPRSIQGTPSTSGASFLHKTLSPLEQQQQSTPVHNSAIQRRLEKLSHYGNVSPAELSPIVLSKSSVRVKKDFIPVTPRPNP